MKRLTLFLVMAVCLWRVPAAPAAVYRTLTGNNVTINADWSASAAGHAFDVVTNGSPLKPIVAGGGLLADSNAIAFQVPTDTSGNKERVEYKILKTADPDGLNFTNARYHGFAFRLGAPVAAFTSSCLFWQAWQGSPWGPPASLKLTTSSSPPYKIGLYIRNMATGPDSTVADVQLWSQAMIQPDTWYSVVLYLAPRYTNNDGNIQLWINGTNYVNCTTNIGYDPSQTYASGGTNYGVMPGLDLKNGIYQPNANNGHTFYFDQIKVADTFAEASPLPSALPPSIPHCFLTNNLWGMTITGAPGALFIVQSSTNLSQWNPVLITNPPVLPFNFTGSVTGAVQNYFRVSSEP